MDTKYNHKEIELGKNDKWVNNKYFSTHDVSKKPFTIILPPPNVTGKLHLGHAWDGFIQDTIIRFKKLKGFDVLFLPGMDHAGIATQAKVEQKLRDNNMPTRQEMGREKFLGKVHEWKEEYASTIRKQWSTLGLALDYDKERFTMDEGLSVAVSKVFIKMYEDKLIYKGLRPINWDTKLQTVLSNIEVISKDTESEMHYIQYPLKDGGHIEIATTRPETIFSDVAIAVNPKDDKMKAYIGKVAINPLNGDELPIIADEYVAIGKGTGAMKVSAHSVADFDIIKANDLEVLEVIDKDGMMNERSGGFKGMERFEARRQVVKRLTIAKYLVKTEKITNAVGYSERSGEVVEVLVQDQWFVKMKPLADKLLKDIKSKGGVNFHPQRFEDVITTWMEDIRDWTISRQLWWGHRLPVWYKDKEVKVQIDSPGTGWVQDEDVLDTWFSSGLAPFSFLGWPEDKKEVERYYPTNLLVTGYDIIFFWVARMYFQGLSFMGEKPFNDVLIHGLIRAEDGQKMSKSLGNGIDPMDVIEKYGADSLRWFLLTNSTPGQDIRYSPQKIEAAWGISNKVWNISRYILEVMPEGSNEVTSADKWILAKLSKLESTISSKMDEFNFTIIGKELTTFIMEDFSSWYVEFSKATPNKKFAVDILKRFLVMLHPFMPFITDHIYNLIDGKEILDESIEVIKDTTSTKEIDQVILITKALREFRVSANMSQSIELFYNPSIKMTPGQSKMIVQLANATVDTNEDALITLGDFNIYVKLSDEVRKLESDRINKEIKSLEFEIKRAEGMLSNKRFTDKAPKDKVKAEQDKLNTFKQELKLLKEKQDV
ncbi:MAG: valine--tRNA ligase [Mycoplasmataceae bacterium]|nr:valine--tRNA ligase [Mycoplasmataceae bacterium]